MTNTVWSPKKRGRGRRTIFSGMARSPGSGNSCANRGEGRSLTRKVGTTPVVREVLSCSVVIITAQC